MKQPQITYSRELEIPQEQLARENELMKLVIEDMINALEYYADSSIYSYEISLKGTSSYFSPPENDEGLLARATLEDANRDLKGII